MIIMRHTYVADLSYEHFWGGVAGNRVTRKRASLELMLKYLNWPSLTLTSVGFHPL